MVKNGPKHFWWGGKWRAECMRNNPEGNSLKSFKHAKKKKNKHFFTQISELNMHALGFSRSTISRNDTNILCMRGGILLD